MWILAVVVPVTFVAACASPQAATRSPSSSAVGSSSPVAPAATAADQALQPVLACGSTNLDKNAAAASSPVAGGSGGVPKPEGSGASEPLAPEPSVAPSGPVQVGAYADLVAANRAYVSYAASTLRILSADVATLQADLARSDLASASLALGKYFDPSSRKTQVAASVLQQVQAQMKAVELPRVDETLAALATAAAGR